jgi:hypothetical protein
LLPRLRDQPGKAWEDFSLCSFRFAFGNGCNDPSYGAGGLTEKSEKAKTKKRHVGAEAIRYDFLIGKVRARRFDMPMGNEKSAVIKVGTAEQVAFDLFQHCEELEIAGGLQYQTHEEAIQKTLRLYHKCLFVVQGNDPELYVPMPPKRNRPSTDAQ